MTDPATETGPSEESAPAPTKRFLFLRRRTPDDPAAPPAAEDPGIEPDAAATAPAEAEERVRPGVLRRRRRQLEGQYQQALFDLGGLAMELHARGLLAEDVMRRKAAEVADVRAQLDELGARLDEIRQQRKERREAGRRPGVTCTACGARGAAGANFCAACGAPIVVAEAVVAEGDQVTTVIDVQDTVVVEADPQPTAAIPPAARDDA